MESLREQQEELEERILSPYAAKSAESRGRDRKEEPCEIRTVYQRDRDRILHCKAFRRMKDKTQVFIKPEGDHYRTRLTHTLEVAQIARTIGRALRLNEDLVEAIALGHDLGHTPFGHSGERVLNRLSAKGFTHYEQGIRTVEVLEKKGKGLNLTWGVRDGIVNHSMQRTPATLEGRVVRLADKIAYINHDIDDALRGHVITEEDLPSEYLDVLGHSFKERINTMIRDVIFSSLDQDDIRMSPRLMDAMMAVREYMFCSVYIGSEAKKEEKKAEFMIEQLYRKFMEDPCRMPEEYAARVSAEEKETVICDYIAGMSDTYAIRLYEQLFVPKGWDIF